MGIIRELIDDVKFILNYRKEVMRDAKELDRKAPVPGDAAPDFTLTDISGEGKVSLSDFQGKKPVALIFGSYT